MRTYVVLLSSRNGIKELKERFPNARVHGVIFTHAGNTEIKFSRREIESSWGVTDTDRTFLAWIRDSLESKGGLVHFNVCS